MLNPHSIKKCGEARRDKATYYLDVIGSHLADSQATPGRIRP